MCRVSRYLGVRGVLSKPFYGGREARLGTLITDGLMRVQVPPSKWWSDSMIPRLATSHQRLKREQTVDTGSLTRTPI